MIIEVEGGGYDTATEALVWANQFGAQYYNSLTGKLGGYGAMAGDDTTSEEFSREYDLAAKDAVGGLSDVVDAFTTLARLTATSIENHRNANANSVYNKPAPMYDGSGLLPGGQPVDVPDYSPPSSLGGDNEDLPDFWNEIVDHLEGFAWPNADTGKLRSAAGTWRASADDVDRLAGYCESASAQLADQTSPEIPLALDAYSDLKQSIRDLAANFRDIGQACDDYATEVEDHRDIIKGIIRDMAIEAGVSIVAGAIVGFFTFGGGAAAGGAIAGWRIASAARKILAALRALKAAAKLRAVAKLTSVVSKVKPLRAVLAKFKNAKKMDNAADAAETGAKVGRHPREVLDDLPNGRNRGVKTVDSDEELQNIYDEMIDGGELIPGRGGDKYDGWYRLPDGTEVGMRVASKSGGRTIDISMPDGAKWKIHIE